MIKVIASDLDGTLLNENHMLSQRTIDAIIAAQNQGLRFMVATGRNYKQAKAALNDVPFKCDWLVSSGAEVRNPEGEAWRSSVMDLEQCKEVYQIMQKYPIAISFGAGEYDYFIGPEGTLEDQILEHIFAFNQNTSKEELRKSERLQFFLSRAKMVSDIDTLVALKPPVTKMFAFSVRTELLNELQKELETNPNIAVASSFPTNLEITDISAQKGPVLKAYIEELGYTMDEVMVFGDSFNDYSMLSLDFGATIAMDNGHPEIKKVAKYVTKSNIEDGVAYAIEELLLRLEK